MTRVAIAFARASNSQGRALNATETAGELASFERGGTVVNDPVAPNGDATRGSPIPWMARALKEWGVDSSWVSLGLSGASLVGTHASSMSTSTLLTARTELAKVAAMHPQETVYRFLFIGTSSQDYNNNNGYTATDVQNAFQRVIDFAKLGASIYTPLYQSPEALRVILQGPLAAQTPNGAVDEGRVQTVAVAGYEAAVAANSADPLVYDAGNPVGQHGIGFYTPLSTDPIHHSVSYNRTHAVYTMRQLGPALSTLVSG